MWFGPLVAHAAGGASKLREWLNTAGNEAGLPTNVTPLDVFGSVIRGILGFAGVVYFILLVYAGWQWMTAMGNEEKISAAKSSVVHSTIGLALILGAYSVVTFVVKSLVRVLTGH
jgi:hypothetical protein